MSDSGSQLRDNNEKIVRLMSQLRAQRDEMNFLIEKQLDEKQKLQTEIEKLTFKLSLLIKSLSQRMQAKTNYDRTLKEIEESYMHLVQESSKLLVSISKEVQNLEEIMDKKTGTGTEVNRASSSEAHKRCSLDCKALPHADQTQLHETSRNPDQNRNSSKPQKPEVSDVAIKGFKEGYERQHRSPSPPSSLAGSTAKRVSNKSEDKKPE